MKNPFKYGCVVGGDNFCERPELERKLAGFVRSGQNVVIQKLITMPFCAAVPTE